MRSKKVVLDTNIFINGIIFADLYEKESDIMNKALNREIYLLFSQQSIGELLYVMKNFARYNLSKEDGIELLQELVKLFYFSKSINTKDTKTDKCNDKYDDMFLECAVEGEADYLVTADNKSGMKDISMNTKVYNPKEFIDIMNNKQEVAIGEANK